MLVSDAMWTPRLQKLLAGSNKPPFTTSSASLGTKRKIEATKKSGETKIGEHIEVTKDSGETKIDEPIEVTNSGETNNDKPIEVTKSGETKNHEPILPIIDTNPLDSLDLDAPAPVCNQCGQPLPWYSQACDWCDVHRNGDVM